jgi:hypothetical protein
MTPAQIAVLSREHRRYNTPREKPQAQPGTLADLVQLAAMRRGG